MAQLQSVSNRNFFAPKISETDLAFFEEFRLCLETVQRLPELLLIDSFKLDLDGCKAVIAPIYAPCDLGIFVSSPVVMDENIRLCFREQLGVVVTELALYVQRSVNVIYSRFHELKLKYLDSQQARPLAKEKTPAPQDFCQDFVDFLQSFLLPILNDREESLSKVLQINSEWEELQKQLALLNEQLEDSNFRSLKFQDSAVLPGADTKFCATTELERIMELFKSSPLFETLKKFEQNAHALQLLRSELAFQDDQNRIVQNLQNLTSKSNSEMNDLLQKEIILLRNQLKGCREFEESMSEKDARVKEFLDDLQNRFYQKEFEQSKIIDTFSHELAFLKLQLESSELELLQSTERICDSNVIVRKLIAENEDISFSRDETMKNYELLKVEYKAFRDSCQPHAGQIKKLLSATETLKYTLEETRIARDYACDQLVKLQDLMKGLIAEEECNRASLEVARSSLAESRKNHLDLSMRLANFETVRNELLDVQTKLKEMCATHDNLEEEKRRSRIVLDRLTSENLKLKELNKVLETNASVFVKSSSLREV